MKACASSCGSGVLPCDWLWPSCQVALHFVTAALFKQRKLLGRFHALGKDRHVEAMPKVDYRAHDRLGVPIGRQVADKSAVDLDLVERERVQIGQRRIAGAEIIERDANAEGLET